VHPPTNEVLLGSLLKDVADLKRNNTNLKTLLQANLSVDIRGKALLRGYMAARTLQRSCT
jgi:hypothetical protein